MRDAASERVIERQIEIAASPEAVWTALTTPEGLENWFPLKAEVTPGVGGSVWMSWGEDWVSGSATITAWEPNEELAMEAPMLAGGPPTVTRFLIRGEGGVTRLRLVHSGFSTDAKFDEEFDSIRTGWEFELGGLKLYLEKHAGEKREVVVRRRPVGRHDDRALARLLGVAEAPAIGDRLRLGLPGAGELSGAVRVSNPPRDVAMVTDEPRSGYFRCGVEGCGGGPLEAILWLSCYGVSEAWREEIGAAFDRLLDERAG